ncbi:MAG TPA: ATPase domain-containing protein [Bryobacteraceae bacterium]|jgi:flagellar biosynthesis protein FlhF|nr:ATPase domain-containing protein [Bryobacteraceae bacterium]
MSAPQENQQLQIKSYFAGSVQDAIEFARSEMGADALLLNSRPAPPEARYLGKYEVVFGRYPERQIAPALPVMPQGSSDVDDLRHRMDDILNLLTRTSNSADGFRSPRHPNLVEPLTRAGIEAALAAEIEDAVAFRLNQRSVTSISRPRRMPEWNPEMVLDEASDEISGRFEVSPGIGRITALVGPPGSGKTTTIVKLAVSQAIAGGHPVRLISADTHRIGGAEQLRTYAAILGVNFQAVENTAALTHAIDSAPANANILIDTPGMSPTMLNEVGMELATFLGRRQDIDTHLVLTATTNQLVLEKAASRFAACSPSRLIVTRLDEAETLGAIFGLAIRIEKPLSFFCHGQIIPEDIEPASKRRITEALVRHLPRAMKPAA